MDATQNNPEIDGSLRNEIKKLKEASPIGVKLVNLNDVAVNVQSQGGVYFKEINNFFKDNGIAANKVIAVTICSWSGVAHIFNIYYQSELDILGFFSSDAVKIGGLIIRVAYLK